MCICENSSAIHSTLKNLNTEVVAGNGTPDRVLDDVKGMTGGGIE